MVNRSVLIQEIDSLSPHYYRAVIDFIVDLKEKKAKKTISLEEAAEAAVKDYCNNKELSCFCAIDGDAFYETR